MAASAEVITKADSTTSTSFHSIAMKYEVLDKQQTISDQCLSKEYIDLPEFTTLNAGGNPREAAWKS